MRLLGEATSWNLFILRTNILVKVIAHNGRDPNHAITKGRDPDLDIIIILIYFITHYTQLRLFVVQKFVY